VRLWEVSFRCRYKYPLVDLSARFPGAPFYAWCVRDRLVLEAPTREPELLDSIERYLREAGVGIVSSVGSPRGRVFLLYPHFDSTEGLNPVFEQSHCHLAPPWADLDGWGYFRIVSFGGEDARRLLRAVSRRGTIEVLRKAELPLEALATTVWSHSPGGGLTRRQVEALVQAHRTGYYRTPRLTTTEGIARSMGVTRSTLEGHLRVAENRLIESVVPYVTASRSTETWDGSLATRRGGREHGRNSSLTAA